jgi:ABC-2 type transport system permease protein
MGERRNKMWVEFRYTMKRMAGGIAGWAVTLGALAVFLIPFYDSFMAPGSAAAYVQLLESMPKEFVVFFGELGDFTSPTGFLTVEFFSYIPLVLGIYFILAGAGMLAGDEESGRMDLILAHPISRTALFFSRILSVLTALVVITLVMWFGMAVTMGSSPRFDRSAWDVMQAFISLGSVMAVLAGLSLFLSLLMPSRRSAMMTVGLYLFASYIVTSLARLSDTLNAVKPFSLLTYYQSGEAMKGLKLEWTLALLVVTVVLVVLSWLLFLRRDIRVSGEGSWGVPKWFKSFRWMKKG